MRLGAGDRRAREELVTRFMPLARSLALRYRSSGEPFDDVLQVASLGLLKAIDRYDASREVAFSSYAVPTILGEIKRHFRDLSWAVRVPRGLQEFSARVDHAVSRLSERHRRAPTISEIAATLEAPEEDVLEALQAGGAYRALSFDAPRPGGEDGAGSTLGDAVGIDEDGFDRAEDRATVARLLKTLSAREREILAMRYELDMTQAEIGAVMGISQMQVYRIIRGSLRRLPTCTTQRPRPNSVLQSPTQGGDHMSDEATDGGEDDPDTTSGTGAGGDLPDEGSTGDEGDGTGEGDAGPASGSSGPGSGG